MTTWEWYFISCWWFCFFVWYSEYRLLKKKNNDLYDWHNWHGVLVVWLVFPALGAVSMLEFPSYADIPVITAFIVGPAGVFAMELLDRFEHSPAAVRRKLEAGLKDKFTPPDDYALYFMDEYVKRCYAQAVLPPPPAARDIITTIVKQLYAEDWYDPTTQLPNQRIQEEWQKQSDLYMRALDIFEQHLFECFFIYARAFPRDRTGLVMVPFHEALPVGRILQSMFLELWPDTDEKKQLGLFARLHRVLERNYAAATRSALSQEEIDRGAHIYPSTFKVSGELAVSHYCFGTPFKPLFDIPVPLPLGDRRLQHTFVLAPSGTGKTQLLQAQLAEDLQKVAAGQASIVVIDSQGINRRPTDKPKLIENLLYLKMLAYELRGKMMYIKPNPDLAFNIFDMGQHAPGLSSEDRRIRVNAARDMIATSLGSGSELQYQMLLWCIRLAMFSENPTIRTLRKILATNPRDFYTVFQKELRAADEDTRNFFDTIGNRNPTKDALIARIDGMLSDDTFRSMLTQPFNDFILVDVLEDARVVVIDADKALIGNVGSEAFGRFFIAQLAYAIRQRKSTMPIYVYIDEAQDFIANEDRMAEMLIQARKLDVGFTIATQGMDYINSSKVKSALTDVGLFFASQNRADAAFVAKQMQTDAEVVANLPIGTFLMSRRGVRGSLTIKVPGFVLENMPKLAPEEMPLAYPPPPQQEISYEHVEEEPYDDEPEEVDESAEEEAQDEPPPTRRSPVREVEPDTPSSSAFPQPRSKAKKKAAQVKAKRRKKAEKKKPLLLLPAPSPKNRPDDESDVL